MGVDVKEIGILLWQILGSSMNISIKFMRNHPIFSGVTMFLLMLYILLPSLLYFLIYSSPVLACVVVYAREKMGLRFSGSQSVTEKSISSSETKSLGGEKSVARSHLRQQRSVRRNARMKVEEWDSQTSEEEKDKVILTSLYNDLLGRTPHFEESPKAIETDVVIVDNEKAFDGDDSSQNLGSLGFSSRDLGGLDGENSMVCSCKEEEYRELDGKEDTREEMSNVNEHGISEIERNRRLESLMARRRARRLFRLALDQRNKLQAEEISSPTHNNNLQIPFMKNRNNGVLEKRRNYHPSENAVGLQMPGSAPSVLLPGRNPFDIPYDPQEERPDLTGDSFDEEFSVFNQKDMFFCRHESFCRFALFSPEPAKCLNSPDFASDMSMPRKHLGLGSEYLHHTEQKRPFKGKEVSIGTAEVVADDDGSIESGNSSERAGVMNEETDSDKEEGDDSSCSEESETELSRMNKTELGEAISHSMENYSSFLVNQTRNSIPSPFPRGLAPRPDDNNMFYTRRCANSHGRTFSIASDMQVEVSELGSPPTTVDWHDDWSNGGESYIYDTDIDREITRGEELQKRVSHQEESTSGIGSKEENTNHVSSVSPVDQHDQKCMVDEESKMVDDKLLLDGKSQTEEEAKQVAEQKPSNSTDVFNSGNSGKFEGLLFHTSASLSSITEEPETILDPINGENPENMEESIDLIISLTSPDSLMNKVIDEEETDVHKVEQLEKNELDESHDIIDSEIIDHPHEDLILDSVQGDHDSEINRITHEHTKPEEYEVTQKMLDPSLDTFCTESLESEVVDSQEPNIGQFTDDLKSSLGDTVTELVESEVMEENGPNLGQFTDDLKSSLGDPVTELVESEVMEENGPNLVEDTDEEAKPLEEEKPQEVLKPSLDPPHTQLPEDYSNAENAETASNVMVPQVQDGDNSRTDESTDQEISTEGENSSLKKDLDAQSVQENSNRANTNEESIISSEIDNSQDSQQPDMDSIQELSQRALELNPPADHEDEITPNPNTEIVKDESTVLTKDSAINEQEDEDKLEHEAKEKELEFNLESLHQSMCLVAKEVDEECKKDIEAMHNVQNSPRDENRSSETENLQMN